MKKQEMQELKNLFKELRNGNKSVIEELYQKYYKIIYGISFSILKNKQDAEDTAQEVFSKLSEIKQEKLPVNNEASWIYTITKNQAISLLRKKSNCLDLDSMYEIEEKNEEINNIISSDSYNRIISKLNEKEREIVSLKILANLSFEEISKLINEPVGTVKWRYYKSMSALKIILTNLGMAIISFVIGIKMLVNNKEIQTEEFEADKNIIQEDNEQINYFESIIKDDEKNTENKGWLNYSKKEEVNDERIDTIVEDVSENETNHVGIGILSVSSVFIVIVIIFTINYLKRQLKAKKKRLNNRKD